MYGIERMEFPSFLSSITNNGTTFSYNSKLKEIDCGKLYHINSRMFGSSSSLKSVVLRRGSIVNLAKTDAFAGCYHFDGTVHATYNPNGLKDGYFYVPRALIEDYKVATNWTTFADQFRALEDYTVDGTTTGAMDWDKINGTTN